MEESIRDMLENKHNVYIDPKSDQFNLNGYDEQYGWQPIPLEWIICEHCGQNEISDDPDIAEEMLCDKCADLINNEGIIGYRKGE